MFAMYNPDGMQQYIATMNSWIISETVSSYFDVLFLWTMIGTIWWNFSGNLVDLILILISINCMYYQWLFAG